MKILNLDLPYRTKPDEMKIWPRMELISEHLIRALVQLRYPQGINRNDARMWGRIMDLMDEATQENGSCVIEVEKSEFNWLLDIVNWCLDNSKIPAMMASWVNTLFTHLETVKSQNEPKLEAVK